VPGFRTFDIAVEAKELRKVRHEQKDAHDTEAQVNSTWVGIQGKRLQAGWHGDHLLKSSSAKPRLACPG
jgi:hypothetical protein